VKYLKNFALFIAVLVALGMVYVLYGELTAAEPYVNTVSVKSSLLVLGIALVVLVCPIKNNTLSTITGVAGIACIIISLFI
tara:strand:- start:217 stop:459 length:243 start_codon:yes stop_codon:yes gene_type:complete